MLCSNKDWKFAKYTILRTSVLKKAGSFLTVQQTVSNWEVTSQYDSLNLDVYQHADWEI